MESVYGEDLEQFRRTVRRFFERDVAPHLKEIERSGTDLKSWRRDFWKKAGAAGLLGTTIPPEYGGAGADPLTILILAEESGRWPAGSTLGAWLGTDICTKFLVENGTPDQKGEWFPKILAGDVIQCMAMTEPESGSDAASIRTTARRDGNEYVINGGKCFISNAACTDLIYLMAKTDPGARGRGISVIMVPSATKGVTQRKLATMGHKLGDTGELFFENVRVPVTNLIGEEGGAFDLFKKTMAFDRMQICVRALTTAESAFEMTLEHVRNRKLFRQRLVDFQNTQFVLAQMETELAVGRAFVDKLILKHRAGTLTDADATMAKIWLPEMEFRVLDQCVQLWGGNGWMDENDISRMFTAARVHRIYGGASELMKAQLGRRYISG